VKGARGKRQKVFGENLKYEKRPRAGSLNAQRGGGQAVAPARKSKSSKNARSG